MIFAVKRQQLSACHQTSYPISKETLQSKRHTEPGTAGGLQGKKKELTSTRSLLLPIRFINGFLEPLVNHATLGSAHGLTQGGSGFAFAKALLDVIEVGELEQDPADDPGRLFGGFNFLSLRRSVREWRCNGLAEKCLAEKLAAG